MREKMCEKYNIGLDTKRLLTVEEGAAYFGVGTYNLKKLLGEPENKRYTAYIGNKLMIKRVPFEQFIDSDNFTNL